MKQNLLALNYAGALFSAASEKKMVTEIRDLLTQILNKLDLHRNLEEIFISPIVKGSYKLRLADLLLNDIGSIDGLLKNFVHIIISNARFNLFRETVLLYLKFTDIECGIKQGTVTTARQTSSEYREAIKEELEKITKTKLGLEFSCDPGLIGGLTLKYDNFFLDCSINGHLSKIKKTICYT
jgi:F-type H+-transporting ATPase subunit delta